MNGLAIEVTIILLGIGVVALLWLAMRFGRTIGIAVLVLGLLAVAVLGAAALATQAGANFQASKATIEAVRAVKTTSSITTIGLVLLVLLLLAMMAGLIAVVAYLALQRRNRSGLHTGNLDGVMGVAISTATITAISQLLILQREMADSLRHRWAVPRRRRSPWRVSAPFLPRSDPAMMAAFLEEDDSEEWESWPDEGGGGEGGSDLWGVN